MIPLLLLQEITMDIQNTRLANGITNVNEVSLFEGMRQPVPTLFHTFFDDFDRYTAANWTVTETQGSATQALVNGDGGWLQLVNSATNDDLVSLQNTVESFTFTAGQRLFFEARIAVDDATQSDVLVGLLHQTTTPFAPTDGVYFVKLDGDTALDFVEEAGDTATTESGISDMADDTFITVGFYYDGVETVVYAVDGVVVGSIDITNLTEDLLTPTFAVRNGEGAAKTMTIDYIYVAKERMNEVDTAVPTPS